MLNFLLRVLIARAWLANGELTVTGGAGEGPAIALTLNWIDAVCTWLEVTEPWTPEDATTLRMEEVRNDKENNFLLARKRFIG